MVILNPSKKKLGIGLEEDLIKCFAKHKSKHTKKFVQVEKDLESLKKKWNVSTRVLVDVLTTISVHIGKWTVFKNIYVLNSCLKKGRETNGFYRPTSLRSVKPFPILKKALIEIKSKSS